MFGCINSIAAWRTKPEPKEFKWKFRKWYFPVLHSISMTSCEGQYLVWDVKTVLWFNEKQADVNRCCIVSITRFFVLPDNYWDWLEENIPQNKTGSYFHHLMSTIRKIETFTGSFILGWFLRKFLVYMLCKPVNYCEVAAKKKLKGHKFFQCHVNLAFWWMFLQYGDAGLV